jgi:hypothetical protein
VATAYRRRPGRRERVKSRVFLKERRKHLFHKEAEKHKKLNYYAGLKVQSTVFGCLGNDIVLCGTVNNSICRPSECKTMQKNGTVGMVLLYLQWFLNATV